MSECKKCGRAGGGHWIGCAKSAQPVKAVVVDTPSPALKAPDAEVVKEVAAEILAAVGSDQMGELYSALGDLIHDHYEPYDSMSEAEKATWRTAVAEELGGEGYGDPAPKAAEIATCAYGNCPGPRRSADKRVKFCEFHSDPKNRK